MKQDKREALEAQGWKIGDTKEFLSLTDEEMEYIEIKIALSQKVQEIRKRRRLTQKETADLIGSSQSRIAKMEAGDPSVSIDLQVKSLLALGVSRSELGEIIKAEQLASA
ncbi:MAG: helix-turn-helix transcriptional regulator [Anaerolineae bacterium]|nr:helix-turn-helix transcriptional regulator [Anaerolineae bacterium]